MVEMVEVAETEETAAPTRTESTAFDSTRGLHATHHACSGTLVVSPTVTRPPTGPITAPKTPPPISNPPVTDPLDPRAKNATNGEKLCKIDVNKFAFLLKDHPDQSLVNYIIDGLTHGFDIGFRGEFTETYPKNNQSAVKNKTGVTEAIRKELKRGHTAGPFSRPPFDKFHCSPIGASIKKDQSVRLVMDLSQPTGCAINEFISKEEFSANFSHFDDAVAMLQKAGKDSYLCKIDIKHAYRLIPVRPDQWPLLGYCWEGEYYYDMVLPFGLRSSASIFNKFADLVRWIIINKYNSENVVNYSDDYLLVCSKILITAHQQLNVVIGAFHDLDIPLAEEKIMGPVHKLPYLGITLNSKDMTMEVTPERYAETMSLLPFWLARRTSTKTELLSLIGCLSFVAKVVRPGRIFLRRLIDLGKSVKRHHHHVTYNKQAKLDIQWWIDFLPEWNCKSIIPESLSIRASDIKLFTDASDIGFGATYGTAWIQGSWDRQRKDISINYRELFAILAAALTWGSTWAGKRIVFFTDNQPITQVWASGTSPAPTIMSLIRALFLTAAKNGFSVAFKHIPGINNPTADALSRFQMARFRDLMPKADDKPTTTPSIIWSY